MKRRAGLDLPHLWPISWTLAAALGCSGGASAPPATADSAEPAADATGEPAPATDAETSTEPAAATSAANAASSPAAEASAPKPRQPPRQLCNEMCDRMAEKCSKASADNCRVNCEQYDHPPKGCDEQLDAALTCAAKAEDLTCVNIAPESCAPHFRRVVACTEGKEDPGAPETVEKIPDGWTRFEAKSAGFSALMPPGVSEKTDTKPPSYATTLGDAVYTVRILPPPAEKPTQKNLVKVAMGVLGKCNQKLKLFGMVEREGKVTIRYDARCPDKAERRGSFVITPAKMYQLEIASPAGSKVESDAFVYNFELK